MANNRNDGTRWVNLLDMEQYESEEDELEEGFEILRDDPPCVAKPLSQEADLSLYKMFAVQESNLSLLLQYAINASPVSYDQEDKTKLAALEMLQSHPNLLFQEGYVKDLTGQWHYGSAYKMFLRTGDITALNEVHEKILPQIPEGKAIARIQYEQQFPRHAEAEEKLYDDRNIQQIAQVKKDVKEIIDAIWAGDLCYLSKATKPRTQVALAKLKEHLAPKEGEVLRTGLLSPPVILMMMHDVYDERVYEENHPEKHKNNTLTITQAILFSCEVIGAAQAVAAPHHAQRYKKGLRNVDPNTPPDRTVSYYLPMNVFSSLPGRVNVPNELGVSYFVCAYTGNEGGRYDDTEKPAFTPSAPPLMVNRYKVASRLNSLFRATESALETLHTIVSNSPQPFPIFNMLPELKKEVFARLLPTSLSMFARTCRQVEQESRLTRLLQYAINALPVFYHQKNKSKLAALEMLKAYPDLLFQEGYVKDLTGQWHYGSAYKMFLRTGDIPALNAVHAEIIPHIPDGKAIARAQYVQQFPRHAEAKDKLYDDRNIAQIAQVKEDLIGILDALLEDTCIFIEPATPHKACSKATQQKTRDAIAKFKKHLAPKEGVVIKTGLLSPPEILKILLAEYNQNYQYDGGLWSNQSLLNQPSGTWNHYQAVMYACEVIGAAEAVAAPYHAQWYKKGVFYMFKRKDLWEEPPRYDTARLKTTPDRTLSYYLKGGVGVPNELGVSQHYCPHSGGHPKRQYEFDEIDYAQMPEEHKTLAVTMETLFELEESLWLLENYFCRATESTLDTLHAELAPTPRTSL